MDRAVAVFLWLAVTAYALTGGADFGGGIWDLLAGGPRRGAAVRELIDDSINPVWEANHVWLIIDLVLLWTAFPTAFAAITSTLFVPLSLVALGTLLRGSGFALRKLVHGRTLQTVTGGLFALSSVVTPLFMGAAAGAIATGRVPAAGGGGEISSWTGPTSWLLGGVAISAFAYLAAVYLVDEARQRGLSRLESYFRTRALVAAVVTGALGGASLVYLRTSAPRTFHILVAGRALPLFAGSAVLGVAAVVLLLARRTKAVRLVAAGAFTAVIWGWGAAQYPYLLPRSLTLTAGAAPEATLVAETVVVGAMVLLIGPSFLYLFRLAARGHLQEETMGVGATLGGEHGSEH